MRSDFYFNQFSVKANRYISILFSSQLVRSSSVYTVSSFINASLPLILLPILTRHLSPEDYGIVAMFQLVVSLIYPFIGMNLEGSISRKFFDKDVTDFSAYVGTCFILVLFSFIVITAVFYANFETIQEATQIPDQWLKYVLLVAVCQFVTTAILVIFQVNVKPVKYGIFQISQSILNVGLTIFFVVLLNKTWNGRIEAQIIAAVIFAIVSFVILHFTQNLKFNVLIKDIKHALSFGIPLIPHAIGGLLFTSIDRFFLTNMVGLEQTGNYTVAYQIGALIGILTFAFNNAYVPWLFENLNRDDIEVKKKIVKLTYIYFALILILALSMILLFPLLVSIFVGSEYTSIGTYSTFIIFGYVFQGMYYMVTNYIMYAERTSLQAAVTITVGLLKLPITYFAILWLGAVGASISFSISWFIFFILTWMLSAKVYKMPWNILRLINK